MSNRQNMPAGNRPPSGGSPQRRQQPPRQQRPKGGSSTVVKAARAFRTFILVVATVIFCIFLAIFILNSASDLFGLNQVDNEIPVKIEKENMTVKELADMLTDKGIVDQKLTFRVYASLKGDEIVTVPGEYKLNSNMAYDQIFAILRAGDIKDKFVTVSFREGLTLQEIADLLTENQVCDGEKFLEYLQNEPLLNYSFYNMIPEDDERFLKMEGYVFPDTYEFYVGENIPSVAAKFLDNFERHIYQDDLLNRMKAINMTLDEVITLASIIEKEASDQADMKRVSSVFHNRLDAPSNFPMLQSDVTLLYAENEIKGHSRSFTIDDTQEVLDAYNTYQSSGLPVGPVCNPGKKAITAALHPAETNYYYFVTDAKGDYYFATNLADHNANVEYARSQDETGEGKVGGIKTREGEDAIK